MDLSLVVVEILYRITYFQLKVMNELHKIVDELVTWKPQGSLHKWFPQVGGLGEGLTLL